MSAVIIEPDELLQAMESSDGDALKKLLDEAPDAGPTAEPAFALTDSAGLVSLSDHMVMPDGSIYQFLYSERWDVITDKQMPVPNFHSAERWQLLAWNEDRTLVLAVIPGCNVKGWVRSSRCPSVNGEGIRHIYYLR
jgi:hypothetical protein